MLGSTDSITSESFAARQRHTTTPIDVQDPVEYSTGTTLDAVGGGNQPALQTLPHNLTGYDAPAAEPPLSAESPDIVAIIDGGGEIQDRINSFFEVVAPTMNALDEIAKVHPMIGALVMSFKTVYTLELRRRRNDKKVLAVYLAMTDMMSILLKLKTMPRIEENPQIQQLIRLTIEDIKQCSNTCDAYAKKKLLVKTVQSGLWNKKLLHFVSLFEKRREQFAIALSIQVHLAVHDTIAKISQIDRSDMLAAFQRLASPEEDQLAELIKTKGGVLAVEKNDLALQELLTVASKATDSNDTELGQYRRSGLNAAEIAALKEDLSENPDAAVEKNSDVFTRKLEVQTRQISEALSLRREGERVIKEVRFRPHDRTSGEGWEDEVNGDEFVPALLRHYAIKFEPAPGSSKDGAMGSEEIDTWAISAIDAAHFRLISEAFDNDVSGTITTAELNVFAISRPRYWSLLHWLAFWAIGWKSSMIWYANRLEDLFARIEGIYSQVLAPNREVVAFYQAKVRRLLHTFTSTLRGEEYAPHWDKFSTYVEEQEKLLIANLQTIDYSIDAVDTIALVTGENRLEKVRVHAEVIRRKT
ncbi:hypothetical protein BC834DRAFT_825092 [Gloeopeniophorella convolvens]|nr:hypothetical protein BC834DRAFT_825092 [Gloeopeniophorella convolvens]